MRDQPALNLQPDRRQADNDLLVEFLLEQGEGGLIGGAEAVRRQGRGRRDNAIVLPADRGGLAETCLEVGEVVGLVLPARLGTGLQEFHVRVRVAPPADCETPI